MEIKRISKEEDFFKLKDNWNSLLQESGSENIFLTWEWLYNWWNVFKQKNDELFILLGSEGSKIVGIAPFYISNNRYKEIHFLATGIVCSEYLSFIVTKENRKNFSIEVFEYLSKNSDSWDLLYLESLSSDDALIGFIKSGQTKLKKWRWSVLKEHICFYLPLLSSIEDTKTIMNRPGKKIEYRKRRLSREGETVCTELNYVEAKELSYCFETVVNLHQKRWQGLGCAIGGIFSNKLMLDFLRIITEEFHKKGWLSIFCLLFDKEPIACGYNFKFGKKIWHYTSGYDPLYKKHSPGLICFLEMIDFYIKQGYQAFDFLRGGESYKNEWTDKFRKEYDILITKSDLKGICFLFYYKLWMFVKNIGKKLIPSKIFNFLRTMKFNKSR